METPLWPSLETASRIFDIANAVLVVSLVLGVAATAVLVWMGGIKEAYLNQELAVTNERAALAEQKTAEAQLKLEELRVQIRPRHITQAQQNAIAEKLKNFKGQSVTLGVSPSNSENQWLVRWLGAPFSMAGWNVEINSGDALINRYVPDGILVLSTRYPRSIATAQQVADAFNAEGLYATTAPLLDIDLASPLLPDDPRALRILVVVGDKPVIPLIETQ